jgi:hypothetical protein
MFTRHTGRTVEISRHRHAEATRRTSEPRERADLSKPRFGGMDHSYKQVHGLSSLGASRDLKAPGWGRTRRTPCARDNQLTQPPGPINQAWPGNQLMRAPLF